MSELLTNFKDDILAESMEGRRRYQMITNEDGTVSIDETMCNGCGLCAKLCKFDAIETRRVNKSADTARKD